ncbi:MAG: hypothetical protein HYY03_00290 [Chloroflexi bacterium]|nr:hypothetical protein [Chloroflexota bacterium]
MRRALTLATALVVAALALLLFALAADTRPGGAQEATVTVGDFFFCDSSFPPGACQTTVQAGDTVRWDYTTGSEGHTVTHCGGSCDSPTAAPLFDSGALNPGQTFTVTFTTPGTYLYLCTFHPVAMRAAIVVLPPTTATAAAPGTTAASEDGGGTSLWWFVLAAVGGGVVVLGGSAVLFQRYRAGV